MSGLSPAARRVVEEHGLNPAQIAGTGKDGRITKEDAMQAAQNPSAAAAPALLNVAFILGLTLAAQQEWEVGPVLAWSVPLGGLAQLCTRSYPGCGI